MCQGSLAKVVKSVFCAPFQVTRHEMIILMTNFVAKFGSNFGEFPPWPGQTLVQTLVQTLGQNLVNFSPFPGPLTPLLPVWTTKGGNVGPNLGGIWGCKILTKVWGKVLCIPGAKLWCKFWWCKRLGQSWVCDAQGWPNFWANIGVGSGAAGLAKLWGKLCQTLGQSLAPTKGSAPPPQCPPGRPIKSEVFGPRAGETMHSKFFTTFWPKVCPNSPSPPTRPQKAWWRRSPSWPRRARGLLGRTRASGR